MRFNYWGNGEEPYAYECVPDRIRESVEDENRR
jgi:hypothetical protein